MNTRTLAAVAIAGPLMFAAAILIQDFIQYDHLVANGDDPWTTSPVSVNALGPYGWIQVLNFGVLGLSVLALAVAARIAASMAPAARWSARHSSACGGLGS